MQKKPESSSIYISFSMIILIDGKRKGVLYVNSKTSKSLIKGVVDSLSLHEGLPGELIT